jgi:hypothetical protein
LRPTCRGPLYGHAQEQSTVGAHFSGRVSFWLSAFLVPWTKRPNCGTVGGRNLLKKYNVGKMDGTRRLFWLNKQAAGKTTGRCIAKRNRREKRSTTRPSTGTTASCADVGSSARPPPSPLFWKNQIRHALRGPHHRALPSVVRVVARAVEKRAAPVQGQKEIRRRDRSRIP